MLVRPARDEERLAVARVHVGSWQAAYRGLLPDAYLDALRPEDRAVRYDFSGRDGTPTTIVAVDGDAVLGFATFGRCDDDAAHDIGELMALYVDPGIWGEGAGSALIVEARSRLVAGGFVRARLWVLVGNARAERFYERDGWRRTGARRSQRIWGIDLDEHGFERRLTQPSGL